MKVYVAKYTTKHDDYICVFTTAERANKWRQDIAEEWWGDEFSGQKAPDDPEKKADEYFEKMMEYGDEFFTIEEHEVIE